MFEFTISFNALLLTDTELGLFSAVVLLSPDRLGVTDIKAIEHHQDRLIEALKLQVGTFQSYCDNIIIVVLHLQNCKLQEFRISHIRSLSPSIWISVTELWKLHI